MNAAAARTLLPPPGPDVRVRVWLGTELISDWSGPADVGRRLEAQQRQDYSQRCNVVCEPVQPGPGTRA
ncbi:hypothetical protein GCM10010522_71860 [Kribbella solani]